MCHFEGFKNLSWFPTILKIKSKLLSLPFKDIRNLTQNYFPRLSLLLEFVHRNSVLQPSHSAPYHQVDAIFVLYLPHSILTTPKQRQS